jgi:Permuted papain-like amidase enzyme, YaeF/YiiX, C92 family
MASVFLVYSNSKLPLSPLIRWRTGSEFSHVGLILEPSIDSIGKDSLVSHSALSSKGIRYTTLKTFISKASNYRITKLDNDISIEQFDKLLMLCRKYEGLKYDLKGAIGLGVDEDWQEDDAFWCSEWVAFLLLKTGMNLQYLSDIHRITPKHNLEWPQTQVDF